MGTQEVSHGAHSLLSRDPLCLTLSLEATASLAKGLFGWCGVFLLSLLVLVFVFAAKLRKQLGSESHADRTSLRESVLILTLETSATSSERFIVIHIVFVGRDTTRHKMRGQCKLRGTSVRVAAMKTVSPARKGLIVFKFALLH